MTTIPSAKPNRDFADGLLEDAREAMARNAEAVRQLEDQLQRAKDRDTAARLRQQIEATKQRGRDREDVGDRLRELGREHHRITGAGGGA